jgi:hypothetical protein
MLRRKRKKPLARARRLAVVHHEPTNPDEGLWYNVRLPNAKISTSANAHLILTFIVGSQCVQAPTAERLASLREEGTRTPACVG